MVRLSLTGSRGLAVCSLWLQRMKTKETRMERTGAAGQFRDQVAAALRDALAVPELEPGLQRFSRVGSGEDKYFYIARGISLIAEGERLNHNNPDMRYTVGFYNQHKIGLADEANVLRSLYQMSVIDPKERNPQRFRGLDEKGKEIVDMAKFEKFCQQHPMLVRRLREILNKNTPTEIVDFLAENQEIPSQYEDAKSVLASDDPTTPLKPPDQRFPCLAPIARKIGPIRRRSISTTTWCRGIGTFTRLV